MGTIRRVAGQGEGEGVEEVGVARESLLRAVCVDRVVTPSGVAVLPNR